MSLPRLIASIAGLAIIGVIAAIGVWYFFIREDAKLATDPPDIPGNLISATNTPAPGGSTATNAPQDGTLTFEIVDDPAPEAAYFVGETLANIGLPSTAKGSTADVTGSFTLNPDGTLAEGATSQFTVGLTSLQSDESRRDQRVQDALDTSQFPTATFTLTSIEGYDASIPEGDQQDLTLTGTLDLHGVQREVTWDAQVLHQANVISGLAHLEINFADYNITPPNIAGFVSVEDTATLEIQFVAQQM